MSLTGSLEVTRLFLSGYITHPHRFTSLLSRQGLLVDKSHLTNSNQVWISLGKIFPGSGTDFKYKHDKEQYAKICFIPRQAVGRVCFMYEKFMTKEMHFHYIGNQCNRKPIQPSQQENVSFCTSPRNLANISIAEEFSVKRPRKILSCATRSRWEDLAGGSTTIRWRGQGALRIM